MFTCGGTIIVIKTTKNQNSLWRKFNLAKEYPASDEIKTCPRVVNNATIILFMKYFVIGISLKTWVKFSKVKFVWKNTPKFWKISFSGVRARFTIAKNGKSMLKAIIIRVI